MVVYRGPSVINGRPIVAVFTGLWGMAPSTNRGTGPIPQLVIMPDVGVAPGESRRTGDDASVCGGCPLRPALRSSSADPICYVQMKGVNQIWRKMERGGYAEADMAAAVPLLPPMLGAANVRLGGWGDPAAVPYEAYAPLWQAADAGRAGVLAYTGLWKGNAIDPRWRERARASAHNPTDVARARSKGWKVYRMRRIGDDLTTVDPLLDGEAVCPKSAEAGHASDCQHCGWCSGTARADAPSIIGCIDHGQGATRLRKHLALVGINEPRRREAS